MLPRLPDNSNARVVAIIGAGFSGTSLAVQLLRQARRPLEIVLIEREAHHFSRGQAYSTFDPAHRLNVLAANMSLLPDVPTHFTQWLQVRGVGNAQSYAPRQLYGQYLDHSLRGAETESGHARLRRVINDVIDIVPTPGRAVLHMRTGDIIAADTVVFALGNFPPPTPALRDPRAYDSHRYFNRAWEPGALEGLGTDDSLLLIGTGLTSVDILISLSRNNHRGRIYAVSRRGVWPRPHGNDKPYHDWTTGQGFVRVSIIMCAIRAEIDAAARTNRHWSGVIDALRPLTASIWENLPVSEQRRFLRHARVYWDAARHRITPESTQLIADMAARGQLTTWRGRLRAITETARGLAIRVETRAGPAHDIETARAINCTGAESNYKQLKDALIVNLMRRGLVRADTLHLGLACAADGALIDGAGGASTTLFTLGPCMKGRLWETTAVPEIRVQALTLARRLLETLDNLPALQNDVDAFLA